MALREAGTRFDQAVRVLVVEDDTVVAADFDATLRELEARVIGPIGSLDEAMKLCTTERPDAAVLDVFVQGKTVFDVAEELGKQQVPFVFATCLDARELPSCYRHVQTWTKPFDVRHVARAVLDLARRSNAVS